MYRSLALLEMCVLGLTTPAAAQVRMPTDVEQAEIQETVHKLVKAINDRNVEGMLAMTLIRFDALMPGQGMGRERLQTMMQKPPDDLRRFELATLVRSVRMLTPEVAFGDGFFRTINLPGGDSAGNVSITLLKREGKWSVATARFAPYPFNGNMFVAVEQTAAKTAAGEDGWITLFDGSSTNAFLSAGGGPFPGSWTIEGDTLKAVAGRGGAGLRTKETFGSFELRFDWKMPPKGNSGIKYRLFYLSQRGGTGHEYQIADDNGDPGAIKFAVERSGALYNQIAPSKAMTRAVGEWNESAIIVRGRHCEHWLNGEKVVEYEAESGPLDGPILFTHHTTEALYRNIRIKRLD